MVNYESFFVVHTLKHVFTHNFLWIFSGQKLAMYVLKRDVNFVLLVILVFFLKNLSEVLHRLQKRSFRNLCIACFQ